MISHLFCNGPALYIKKFRLLFVQKSPLFFFFAKSWLLFVQKSPLFFFFAKSWFLFLQKSPLSFFFAKSWLLFVQKSPLSFFIAKQVFRTKYGILIASKKPYPVELPYFATPSVFMLLLFLCFYCFYAFTVFMLLLFFCNLTLLFVNGSGIHAASHTRQRVNIAVLSNNCSGVQHRAAAHLYLVANHGAEFL